VGVAEPVAAERVAFELVLVEATGVIARPGSHGRDSSTGESPWRVKPFVQGVTICAMLARRRL
jgi:hypothetical protein